MMRLGCLLIAATCTALAGRVPAQAPRVYDSAGVRIIDNGSRASAPVRFGLSSQPEFDVGGLKDNADDELDEHNGYLQDVALSDGTHVVADGTRLRWFDPGGKQLRVVGRKGQGPHEFLQVASICRTRDDTLVVSDPPNGRVEILDRHGDFVNEFTIGPSDRVLSACFADGSFVVSEYHRGATASTQLVRRRVDGPVIDSLGTFVHPPFSIYLLEELSVTASRGTLYVGDPVRSEVRGYDEQGRLAMIVRTADPVARISASELDAMQPLAYGVGPGARPISDFPKPRVWPAYDRVATDPDGRLWIEDYRRTRDAPDGWTAFDRDGRMLGRLELPPSAKREDPRWLRFTQGGVQLQREDADGAIHVSTYRLEATR